MAHKERLCAYWHCRRTGGTECWNWGGKFEGRNARKATLASIGERAKCATE